MATTVQDRVAYLVKRDYRSEGSAARAIGILQPTLHGILHGRTKEPRTNILQLIAAHFRVSLDWLVTGQGAERVPVPADDPRAEWEAALARLQLPEPVARFWDRFPNLRASMRTVHPRINAGLRSAAARDERDRRRDAADRAIVRACVAEVDALIAEWGVDQARAIMSAPETLARLRHLEPPPPPRLASGEVLAIRDYLREAGVLGAPSDEEALAEETVRLHVRHGRAAPRSRKAAGPSARKKR